MDSVLLSLQTIITIIPALNMSILPKSKHLQSGFSLNKQTSNKEEEGPSLVEERHQEENWQ